MEKHKQLDLLRKGVEEWNTWRTQNQEISIDLSGANLYYATLNGANLRDADLRGANLRDANLSNATLIEANLSGANLRGANLTDADLSRANLYYANLYYAALDRANLIEADLSEANLYYTTFIEANLSRANLKGANFSGTTLKDANLSEAKLSGATFNGTTLSGAIFNDAHMGWTIFVNMDLSTAKGLETVTHDSPSSIGIDTIYASHGKIPNHFLYEAGVQESFIEVMAAITNQPIEYYSCYISCSSNDEEFAQRLRADLKSNRIRCWFAPEDMRIGDKIRVRIDESIRLYDKLLLVLSEDALASAGVEFEVEAAFAKERREKRTVLFPVRLDSTVINSTTAWAAHIQDTRYIGNFESWKDHDPYMKAFDRLLHDLKADAARDGR